MTDLERKATIDFLASLTIMLIGAFVVAALI